MLIQARPLRQFSINTLFLFSSLFCPDSTLRLFLLHTFLPPPYRTSKRPGEFLFFEISEIDLGRARYSPGRTRIYHVRDDIISSTSLDTFLHSSTGQKLFLDFPWSIASYKLLRPHLSDLVYIT